MIHKQIAILVFSFGFLLIASILGVLPTQTTARVFAAGETPTPVATQTITPTQYGSFVLTRPLATTPVYNKLPVVQIPTWLKLSADELQSIGTVRAQYLPMSTGDLENVSENYYGNTILAAEEFLGRFPESDGAIPVLMMLGNVRTLRVGWYHGSTLRTQGEEYEKAILLLVTRHPERILNILDDLVALGLPISQIKSAQVDKVNSEALLFAYQFDPFHGEPKGQLFSLVKNGNEWKFVPFRPQYPEEWQHNVTIEKIGDINNDGQNEVMVSLEHGYAGGTGYRIGIFSWEKGEWVDRLKWNALNGYNSPGPDAYYGEFWLEDANRDGVQELVVEYFTGSPGGESPPTIDIYQWDTTSQTYINTLSIKSQICGYHAFAEAERLHKQGQFKSALPWYREARTRWLNELKSTGLGCRYDKPHIQWVLAQSYRIELQIQNRLDLLFNSGVGVNHFKHGYLVNVVGKVNQVTKTITETTVLKQAQVNYFFCDTPTCRMIRRTYPATDITRHWIAGESVACAWSDGNYFYTGAYVDDPDIQIIHWKCQGKNKDGSLWFEWDNVETVNVCAWNEHYFHQLGNRVVYPSVYAVTSEWDIRKRLEAFFESLPNFVDCSGDN